MFVCLFVVLRGFESSRARPRSVHRGVDVCLFDCLFVAVVVAANCCAVVAVVKC